MYASTANAPMINHCATITLSRQSALCLFLLSSFIFLSLHTGITCISPIFFTPFIFCTRIHPASFHAPFISSACPTVHITPALLLCAADLRQDSHQQRNAFSSTSIGEFLASGLILLNDSGCSFSNRSIAPRGIPLLTSALRLVSSSSLTIFSFLWYNSPRREVNQWLR